jgi:hypothetical protein
MAISIGIYLLGEWSLIQMLAFTAVMFAFTVVPNWFSAKRYIEEAKNHYIEVQESSILSFGEGYKSETDLSSVNSIVINKNRSGIKSIILKSKKGVLARLENYEDIDKLAEYIKGAAPNANVTERRWIHS